MNRKRLEAALLLCVCGLSPARAGESLRFAAWKYGMAGQDEFYRDLAREFEKRYPGRHVQIELGDWHAAHDSLKRWTEAPGGPDLAITPDVWLAEFAPALEPYAGSFSGGFLSRFQPIMLERSRHNGAVLGFVWAASTKALFYRTDLFEKAGLKPPATWVDLVAAARSLHRPPEIAGISMPGARALDTADHYYFLLWSCGGDIFGKDGKVALDSPAALEALNLYRDLTLRHRVTEPNMLDCDKQCAEDIFARGQAAMTETGPWAITAFRSSPSRPPFAVVPLPPVRQPVTQLVTDHLVLFRNSRHKNAALDFIRLAYDRGWRLRWARMGMLPELKEVAEDEFFQNDPAWRVFLSVLPRSRWIPIRRWEPVDRAIRDTLAEVLAGRQQPEAALKDFSIRLAAPNDRLK